MITQQLFFSRSKNAKSAEPSSVRQPMRAFSLRGALLAATAGAMLTLSACGSQPSTDQTDAAGSGSAPASTETAAAPSTDAGLINVFAEDGVAIKGADPVAYFTEEAFVPGSADFTHEWQGVTWQFSSAENRDLFAANPEQYAPQYGGYCAWAVGQNSLAAIDPNAWSIVDGKLYLNANRRIQSRWNEDIPGNIALADENWPALSM